MSPAAGVRLFLAVGDADLLNPNVMRDGMHDWVEANHRMARVLKAKGYEYQYLFCRGAGHNVGNAQQQFLPRAIEWVWKGHAPKKDEWSPLPTTAARRHRRCSPDGCCIEIAVFGLT